MLFLAPLKRFLGPNGIHPRRLGSEEGLALPVALMLLFVISTISAGVATATVTSSHQASRDRGVKRAIAAADAGTASAVYRMNKVRAQALQCIVKDTTTTILFVEALLGDGWCREQTEDLGDGTSYRYRVSPAVEATVNGQVVLQRKIVSTGIASGVRRRTTTVVGSATGRSLFGGYAVISLSDLNLPNSTRIGGNAGTNGHVNLSNSAEICGNITFGIGKQLTTANSSEQCPGFINGPATQPFLLNPVDQGLAATINDNARIGVQDPLVPTPQTLWDPVRRVLILRNGAVLTISGNTYSFCYLELSNSSQLIVAARGATQPPLKMFIDDPASCPGVADPGTVHVRNNSSIQNQNTDPITLQINMVGSATTNTTMEFSNSFSSEVPMVIYAPRSTVSLENNQNFVGAIGAKDVRMQNSARISYHQNIGDLTLDGLLPLYRRQAFHECISQSPGAPDAGC